MKIYATTIVDNITGGFIRRTYLARLMLGLMTLLAFTGCQTPGPEFKGAGEPSANPPEAITLREGDVLKITFPGAPSSIPPKQSEPTARWSCPWSAKLPSQE